MPETGFGIFVPSEAGDPDGGGDQAVPLRPEAAGDVEDVDPPVLVPAMALAVEGFGAVGRRLAGSDGLERVVQGLLIALDLDDQVIPAVSGRLKCFFDSASRPP